MLFMKITKDQVLTKIRVNLVVGRLLIYSPLGREYVEKYQYSLHSGEKKCEVCQTHYYTWDCDTQSILWDENTPIIT